MVRILVIENVPGGKQESWWKEYVSDCNDVIVDTLNVWLPNEDILGFIYEHKSEISKLIRIGALIYKRMREHQYDIIITIQGGRETFLLACFQTVFMRKRPAHVVIDFIMREKTSALRSKLKYAFMKWCLSSVALVVCSASSEVEYYERQFGWRKRKATFIPLYVRPMFRKVGISEGEYIVSAGRTFRDYETLLKAVDGLDVKVLIVAGRRNFERISVPVPSNVQIVYDIHLAKYAEVLAQAKFVVLPLQEREISVGQQALLESMALKKAVIVTNVPGIRDYVKDGITGLVVRPGDHLELRGKIVLLDERESLRGSLGAAAYEEIRKHHQVRYYISDLWNAINGRGN